jgi:hypothetical protein
VSPSTHAKTLTPCACADSIMKPKTLIIIDKYEIGFAKLDLRWRIGFPNCLINSKSDSKTSDQVQVPRRLPAD